MQQSGIKRLLGHRQLLDDVLNAEQKPLGPQEGQAVLLMILRTRDSLQEMAVRRELSSTPL